MVMNDAVCMYWSGVKGYKHGDGFVEARNLAALITWLVETTGCEVSAVSTREGAGGVLLVMIDGAEVGTIEGWGDAVGA